MKGIFYTPFGYIEKTLSCNFDENVEGTFSFYNCSGIISLYENRCDDGISISNRSIRTSRKLCVIKEDIYDIQTAYYCRIGRDVYIYISNQVILGLILMLILGFTMKYIYISALIYIVNTQSIN